MAHKQPIELFMPPNMLKAKAGGGLGGMDMAAMKRAELAMGALKEEFADWLAEDIKKLSEATSRFARAPDGESRGALLRAAHDIKGQAATFEFPLIARVAGSLSRLLATDGVELPMTLVEAHVNAVRVIHKLALKGSGSETALALSKELEARVDEILQQA